MLNRFGARWKSTRWLVIPKFNVQGSMFTPQPPRPMALATAGVLVLAACEATPTPSPTVPPTPAPSLTSTPSPTQTQTRTRPPLPTQKPSRTLTPTWTATITPGPSPTGTPQPPLTAHQWQPGPVLIQMGVSPVDVTRLLGPSPDFILYSSGQLIIRKCDQNLCNFRTQTLPRREVCSLLNTIDQFGFFDYDPATFHAPESGARSIFIEVNGWRRASLELSQLDRWLADPNWFDKEHGCDHCAERPVIPPALRNTYHLLTTFLPAKMKDYQADRLGVWLSKPYMEGAAAPWMPDSPSLADLQERAKCPSGKTQALVLPGAEAIRVSEYTNRLLMDGYAPIFTEGDLRLQVVSQWLLPEQSPAACDETSGSLPAAAAPTSSAILSCDPQDGQIPTPSATPLWYH